MPNEPRTMSRGRFIFTLITTVLFFVGLPLLLAGRINWIEGWLFGLWFAVMIDATVSYMYAHDPALLAERSRPVGSANQKAWDKVLQYVIYATALSWMAIMPLDAGRFHWSPAFPLWIKVIGGLLMILSLYLIYRATVENTFLSAQVRIQSERKQTVISTGVYGFVRHPLYLGALCLIIGAPLLLGSVVGLVIGVVGAATLIYRILGEEKMLVEELEGYTEYKQKVKYRLIPFVW